MDPLADQDNLITLGRKIKVPAHVFNFSFARSGGPGGQNVNKLATQAILCVNVDELKQFMPDSAVARLKSRARRYLNSNNELIIKSSKSRSQLSNRKDCINKLSELVSSAIQPPKRRKKTSPTPGAIRRRLEEKKKRGLRKQSRQINRDAREL